jgi:predicted MFS family arabinose efflux permease
LAATIAQDANLPGIFFKHAMKSTFSRYEILLIVILTFLQFTIILDFMVLSPLSAILLPQLSITTTQFGIVVSAYAWSAGASGILAAGFADKFDRKKLLLFFYAGFIAGTVLCGIAPNYNFLLIARVITGIFGGVIGSITYAITTDTFPLSVRGRVMGFLQMAFAGASVLGLPVGLYLANEMGWHAPFLMIVGVGILIFIIIAVYMQPVDKHLAIKTDRHPIEHLIKTVSHPTYAKAFACTILLTTGGFMLMPFGSAYTVNNLGISIDKLPLLYLITGICAMIAAPMIGKLSDSIGKYAIFCICSVILIGVTVVYCNLDVIPFWVAIIISILMFTNVSGRMVSSSALVTAIPEPADRGAFMSINSSVNMVSGGIASLIAGTIVYQTQSGHFENYDILGYVVAVAAIITIGLMYIIDQIVRKKNSATVSQPN